MSIKFCAFLYLTAFMSLSSYARVKIMEFYFKTKKTSVISAKNVFVKAR